MPADTDDAPKKGSRNSRRRYYVSTWDTGRQEFTPQAGVRAGPYSLFGLRRALRKLQRLGYSARRPDPYVLVERRD